MSGAGTKACIGCGRGVPAAARYCPGCGRAVRGVGVIAAFVVPVLKGLLVVSIGLLENELLDILQEPFPAYPVFPEQLLDDPQTRAVTEQLYERLSLDPDGSVRWLTPLRLTVAPSGRPA